LHNFVTGEKPRIAAKILLTQTEFAILAMVFAKNPTQLAADLHSAGHRTNVWDRAEKSSARGRKSRFEEESGRRHPFDLALHHLVHPQADFFADVLAEVRVF
jgi:hypothetical protein